MARRIIGLDIGSYSIKMVGLESGLREFTVERVAERRIPQGSTDTSVGMMVSSLIREMLNEMQFSPEVVITGIPGDKVFTRKLTLPFTDRKKIDSVLGFELDGQLPVPLEDVVYDYQMVKEDAEGATLFTASVERHYLAAFLKMLAQAGVDPRAADLGAFAYYNFSSYLDDGQTGTVAIVDFGHRKTEICIVDEGDVAVARTLSRGGNNVTREIDKAFEMSEHEAEALKHQRGYLVLDHQMPGEGADKQLAEAVRRAMFPLIRDIHGTLAAFRSRGGGEIETIYICGGGSRLGGLYDYLESVLGVTIEPLRISSMPFMQGDVGPVAEERLPKAASLALRGVLSKSRSFLNFRRGSFAYEGDFNFFRERLRWLLAVCCIFLLLGGAKLYQRYDVLSRTAEAQKENLAEITKQLTGRKIRSFKTALKTVTRKPDLSKTRILPTVSSFRLFYDITKILAETNELSLREKKKTKRKKAPTRVGKKKKDDKSIVPVTVKKVTDGDLPEKAEIYIDSINIRPKTVRIQARANAVESKNKFIDRLNQYRCFKHQKIDEQNPRTLRFGGKVVYRFTLTIGVMCDPPTKKRRKRKKR